MYQIYSNKFFQVFYIELLITLLLLVSITTVSAQTCGGDIIRGCSGAACLLDPDGDGDIVENATGFTNCGGTNDEIDEFEDLRNPTGCATCQRPWIAIPGYDESIGDLWAGGSSCGNTEIVGRTATDNTYAYYCIIDPDGTCDSGDERLVFRLRTATSANGSFSYSLLVDTDGAVGAADPDGIQCASKVANAGFEYEIIANPGNNRTVDVIDINGQVGTGTVVASHDNDIFYNQANACQSACGCAGGSVYHTFTILLSDIGKDCSDQNFLFAGGSAASGNGTVSSNTSIADVGGIGPLPSCPAANVPCNCCQQCGDASNPYYCGGNTDVCLFACLNACVADSNGVSTSLPVEFTSFEGTLKNNTVELKWVVASELNNDYYEVQRSRGGSSFETIGRVLGAGTSSNTLYYNYTDETPLNGNNYYRLKQVDFDESFQYSKIVVANFNTTTRVSVYPTVARTETIIRIDASMTSSAQFSVLDIHGKPLKTFTRPVNIGYNKVSLNIDDLTAGVYFISIEQNNTRKVLKFVKVP